MTAQQTIAARLSAACAALGYDDPFLELELELELDADLVLTAARAFSEIDDDSSYLLLALLRDRIPTPDEVIRFRRDRTLRGAAALGDLIHDASSLPLEGRVQVTAEVIVDVSDTVSTAFTTGIQRVVRETLASWLTKEDAPQLVAWNGNGRLVAVNLDGGDAGRSGIAVIPFRGVLVLPEIAVDEGRAARLEGIARYAGCRTIAIGHDCIPITSAEVTSRGMPGAFTRYLGALAWFDEILTTSVASTDEFLGWRAMLPAVGLVGPAVLRVPLACEVPLVSRSAVERVAQENGLVGRRIVLSVGSHEPRKNHVRLLDAASRLWDEGLEFELVMVGGNSWDTAEFTDSLERLARRGRIVHTLSNVSDETVYSLYTVAAFTVFPSLNEGFGLPVVESLASGTPVVTSSFGSMRELGEGHGALLVDPSDETELTQACRLLLTDGETLARLRENASTIPLRSWSAYANDVWERVVAAR